MKTILVTGGNRGIGLEICRQLHRLGHTLIMGSRDIEKGNAAAIEFRPDIIVKQLDVTNDESIQNLFEFVRSHFGKLDVLINNAGIGELSYNKDKSPVYKLKTLLETHVIGVRQFNLFAVPFLRKAGIIESKGGVGDVPLDSVKKIMETNLYGAWRMSQIFIPLLEKSKNGRIINISSGMGELANLNGLYPGYSMSKVCLNALTIMFAKELKDRGISVNAICPGWVKTDMGGINAPLNVNQGADSAVWLATENKIPNGKFIRNRKEINW